MWVALRTGHGGPRPESGLTVERTSRPMTRPSGVSGDVPRDYSSVGSSGGILVRIEKESPNYTVLTLPSWGQLTLDRSLRTSRTDSRRPRRHEKRVLRRGLDLKRRHPGRRGPSSTGPFRLSRGLSGRVPGARGCGGVSCVATRPLVHEINLGIRFPWRGDRASFRRLVHQTRFRYRFPHAL